MKCRAILMLACCAALLGSRFPARAQESSSADLEANLKLLHQIEADAEAAKHGRHAPAKTAAPAATNAAPVAASPAAPSSAAPPAATAPETSDANARALELLRQMEAAPPAAKPVSPQIPVAPPGSPPTQTQVTAAPSSQPSAPPPVESAASGDNDANANALAILRQMEAGPAPTKKPAPPAQPTNQATVSIVTSNSQPAPLATNALSYQWFINTTNNGKETLSALSITNAQLTNGAYGVVLAVSATNAAPPPAVVDPAQAQRDFLAAKKAALQAEQQRLNEAKKKAMEDEIAAGLAKAQASKKPAVVTNNPAAVQPGEVAAPSPLDATLAQQEAALQSATGQTAPANIIVGQNPSTTNPTPATREEKLADLTRQWRDGLITPLQYYTQRARIIAEP